MVGRVYYPSLHGLGLETPASVRAERPGRSEQVSTDTGLCAGFRGEAFPPIGAVEAGPVFAGDPFAVAVLPELHMRKN